MTPAHQYTAARTQASQQAHAGSSASALQRPLLSSGLRAGVRPGSSDAKGIRIAAKVTDLEVVGSQLERTHVGHVGIARRQAA